MKTLDDIYKLLEECCQKINKDQNELARFFPEKRKQAETEAVNDLKKSAEQLLADIHDESLDDQSRHREMTVARTMARFASLQVLLSSQTGRLTLESMKQADLINQENMKLQKTIAHLTWGIFWLTLALTFVGGIQIYSLLK